MQQLQQVLVHPAAAAAGTSMCPAVCVADIAAAYAAVYATHAAMSATHMLLTAAAAAAAAAAAREGAQGVLTLTGET